MNIGGEKYFSPKLKFKWLLWCLVGLLAWLCSSSVYTVSCQNVLWHPELKYPSFWLLFYFFLFVEGHFKKMFNVCFLSLWFLLLLFKRWGNGKKWSSRLIAFCTCTEKRFQNLKLIFIAVVVVTYHLKFIEGTYIDSWIFCSMVFRTALFRLVVWEHKQIAGLDTGVT